jgi:hypothetical protein
MNSSPGSDPNASSSETPVRTLTRCAAPASTQPASAEQATVAADIASDQTGGRLTGAGRRDFLPILYIM